MNIDLSALEDFQPQLTDSWNNWSFKHQQLSKIPLSFFSRFDRMGKCCDLTNVPARTDQNNKFITVQGNMKAKNKNFIWKDNTMVDRKKTPHYNLRVLTKKAKKNYRPWVNQIKTKFKQLTVKKEWTLLKNINKNFLQSLQPVEAKVQTLKSKGSLRLLNQQVERINWKKQAFKMNEQYKVSSAKTQKDAFLRKITSEIYETQSQKVKNRKHVVCSLEFLLAIMTVRGGQFPWTLTVEKIGNILTMESYTDQNEDELSYLDLFTSNQNTNNNMPRQQHRVRQNCLNATILTKAFKDLLASEDKIDQEDLQVFMGSPDQQQKHNEERLMEQQQQNQSQKQAQEEQNEQDDADCTPLDQQRLHKYVKITLGDIDIYTKVTIDGVKKKSTGQLVPVLIRTFVQTQTDGVWIKDINNATTGKIVSQQWQNNACSVQKWICQAKLAGVQHIKTGYMGIQKQRPYILNCEDVSVSSLENFLSFKMNDCWTVAKRILNLMFASEDGTFILSRGQYTPLSMKLYKTPEKQASSQQEDQQNS